nr:pyridoxamine 5'-phosphate oxidase family protein [Rhizobium laguerreae]
MTMKLTELTPAQCYRILESAHFGHLACCKNGQPYVAAIYFAFSSGVAYSFTMPGKKLDWMRGNDRVCFTSSSVPPSELGERRRRRAVRGVSGQRRAAKREVACLVTSSKAS